MIRVSGKAAIYGEIWFDETMPRDPGVDILLYRHQSAPLAHARAVRRLTLVLDLAPPPEALMASFNRDCRQKIRRAESKDRLQSEFLASPGSRLREFCDFFDRFALQKSLPPCDRPWLEAVHRSGRLVLSLAWQNPGEPLVWHAHVNMGHTVWLQHSASCFRDKDSEARSLIGRANRWLHWQDIQRYRQMGARHYDWGGLFEDESIPEQEGINRFKKSFGGRVEHRYDCTVPLTLKGHVYLPLRDAWRRWHAAPAAAAA